MSDEIAQAYNEIREQTSNLPPPGNDRLDILTGLDSREAIEGTIIFLLALKARYDNLFSLVLVEFDHFDAFNIQHGGRAEGDRVLRELADIIKESTRDTDAAGRYNGQEFVVVLPETGLEGACVFGERLRQKVEQRLPISISCGLATVADGLNIISVQPEPGTVSIAIARPEREIVDLASIWRRWSPKRTEGNQEIAIAVREDDGAILYLDPTILAEDPDASYPTGLEVFTVWPLGIIVLHLAFLGILCCYVAFPIFGRPRQVALNSDASNVRAATYKSGYYTGGSSTVDV